MQPELTETPLHGTESEVSPRRRDRIEPIRLDVIEMIVALRVSYRQTILRPAQAHRRAFDRITVTVKNAARNVTVRSRRRGVRSQRPGRELHDVCLSHPVVDRIEIEGPLISPNSR